MEDEAALIKSKYSRKKEGVITRQDLFVFNPPPMASQSKPLNHKELSSQEKKLIAEMTRGKGASDEKQEDMMIALELLNKYKKDPAFIQKELQQQKKQRDQIFQDDQEQAPKKSQSKQEYFNPLLTQEERHKIISEKREKRK